MNRIIGIALIVVSSIAYGAMPILARLAYADGASTTTVLFLRFTIAALVMLVLMLATRNPFPGGKKLAGLVLMGVFGYVAQSLAYFSALTLAPASLVALILYLAPVIVTAGSFIVFKEPVTRSKVIALALALTGAVLTIGPGASSPGGEAFPNQTQGVLIGVFAAVAAAVYVLAGSRLLRSVPALPATTVIITSTGAAYTAIAAAQGFQFPQHFEGYAAILALAVVSTVIAIGAFLAGLARIGPTTASTLGILEPATAIALAAIILGETLLPTQIIGAALIVAGVLNVTRG